MPRYVILTHDWPNLHWDLMLEADNVLWTWRLLHEPQIGKPIPAEPLPDHRIQYLDYEGPVSGNRGTVTRWDAGEFTLQTEAPAGIALRLQGGRLQAFLTITRIGTDKSTATFTNAESEYDKSLQSDLPQHQLPPELTRGNVCEDGC